VSIIDVVMHLCEIPSIKKKIVVQEVNKEEKKERAKAVFVKDGIGWSGKGRMPQPFKGLSKDELEQYRQKD
jgi:hypothetical protein